MSDQDETPLIRKYREEVERRNADDQQDGYIVGLRDGLATKELRE